MIVVGIKGQDLLNESRVAAYLEVIKTHLRLPRCKERRGDDPREERDCSARSVCNVWTRLLKTIR